MAGRVWTRDEVLALGVRVDGLTAVQVAYGVGRTKGYTLLKNGGLGFKVIRVPGTNRYVVPTASLIAFLDGQGADEPADYVSDHGVKAAGHGRDGHPAVTRAGA